MTWPASRAAGGGVGSVAVWLERWGIDGGTLAIGAASIGLGVIASLLLTGYMLLRLPADHFRSPGQRPGAGGRLRQVGKNVAGVLLIGAGIVLSIPGVPGQGLLTILLGLALVDIPGKRRLERAILERRGVLSAINRFRRRFGRQPLEL